MYSVGGTLPVDELHAGSYLLSAPAMAGKYDLLLSLVVEGIEAEEGALLVTTNDHAADVVEDVESRLGRFPERLRLVDCVTERGGAAPIPGEQVEYVSSPADLTGMGIAASEHLRWLAAADVGRTRVGFYSISTLMMYADLETVFRFLHVLTGRIDAVSGLGAFAIDPSAHDEGTVNTIKQLFDGMVQLREADGGRELRFVGVDGAPTEWAPTP